MQATDATNTPENTEKTVGMLFKTLTTPREATRTGSGGRARVLTGAKDVAAIEGASTIASSRARVRPMTTA